jgi:hypothetical protein
MSLAQRRKGAKGAISHRNSLVPSARFPVVVKHLKALGWKEER